VIASVPGLVTAANSRTLFIGAPDLLVDADHDGIPDNPGILTPTPVSTPVGSNLHSTYFEVEILSTDNQNLAHTVLTVTVPMPTGITVHAPYDPGPSTTDAAACSPSDVTIDGVINRVITCNYGSLSARGERTIALVVDVASTFNAANQAIKFVSAKVETNNETGPNQQIFTADSGSFQVQAFNANHLASWVPPGQIKEFSTSALGGDGGKLSTKVNFTSGANETVAINEDASDSSHYPCPTGFACQTDPLTGQSTYSEVKVGNGLFPDFPYFTWTLTLLVPKTYTVSQGFVLHYLSPSDTAPEFLYFKNKSSYCGSNIQAKIEAAHWCILGTPTLAKPVNDLSKLTIIVILDHQGGMKA